MDPLTMLIHGDEDQRWDASITPSIAQGTNWAFSASDDFRLAAEAPLHAFMYNRKGNPNHEQVSSIVAQLEGAERAIMTATGMSAATLAVLTLVSAGDHVVGQRSMYAGVSSMMLNLLPRFGVEFTEVDQTDPPAFEAAMRPNTKLVLLETPSNPLLEVTDLDAVTEIARAAGAVTLADNTFATPINQRPIDHGVDLVWHSATKYLGGHSDLMAGVVAGSTEHIEQMWQTSQVLGGILSPFNAWLLLRGLRTLSLRVEQHNRNGLALATALADHPAVAKVHYPGLPDHPGHEIAARQMRGFGGMMAFELRGGYDAAEAFIRGLKLTKRATSLGHVGSLVVHPASMWIDTLSPEQLEDAGVALGLLRFSAGAEHQDDLLADVVGALERVGG